MQHLFRFRIGAAAALLIGCWLGDVWLACAESDADQRKILFDFEAADLDSNWLFVGGCVGTRKAVAEGAAASGPEGMALRIDLPANSGLYTKAEMTLDWSRMRQVEFWAYRAAAKPGESLAITPVELQFIEKDGKSRFWRRIELDHVGWKKISVPINRCRWSVGKIPQWGQVTCLGFWFRGAAELELDSIAAVMRTTPTTTILPPEELATLAFPGVVAEQIQTKYGKHVVVETDSDLPCQPLVDHLDKVSEAVFADFPFLAKPREPVPMVVFSNADAYRGFPPRFARAFMSAAAPPTADGFTFMGISTSYWPDEVGTIRPVFTHEYVHALLTQMLRIDCRQEWWHEGLASMYQLQHHPQADINALYARLLADPTRMPLQQLSSGEPIGLGSYLQACALADMLLHSDRYRPHAEKLVTAMMNTGSTTLKLHLESVMKTTWTELEQEWKQFVANKYLVN